MIEQLVQISREQKPKLYASMEAWATDYFAFTSTMIPIDKAIFGGFGCQQLSFAFMAGYQAALAQMFPTIGPNQLKALCVSEAGGVHPKAIETTLVDHQINGVKSYVTAGSEAQYLLVLCKTEELVNNRPLLKMVALSKEAHNMEVVNFALPFMKEIKHGKLTLKDTKIESNQILEGDGYDDYTKPFRTLEDICLSAAFQAMLLRQAIDQQWDTIIQNQILLSLFTLKNLIQLPLSNPETILLVAANEQNFKRLLPQIEQAIAEKSPDSFKADWEGNKSVLSMGEKLKALRVSKSRAAFFG